MISLSSHLPHEHTSVFIRSLLDHIGSVALPSLSIFRHGKKRTQYYITTVFSLISPLPSISSPL